MQLQGGGCSRPAGRGEGPSMQVWLGVSEGRHEVLGAPTPRKRVLLRQACTSEGQHCPQLQPPGKDHAHRATRGTGNPRRRGHPVRASSHCSTRGRLFTLPPLTPGCQALSRATPGYPQLVSPLLTAPHRDLHSEPDLSWGEEWVGRLRPSWFLV